MTLKNFTLLLGLFFTTSAHLVISQSALAQSNNMSDVTGPSVTTSVQNAGSTTSPDNGSNFTGAAAVNTAAVAVGNSANLVGAQTVGNAAGQAITITVSSEAAAAVASLLAGSPPSADALKIASSMAATKTATAEQVKELSSNPSVAAILNSIPSSSLSTSPQMTLNAIVLAVALQGLSSSGNVSPLQLQTAVTAYNNLVTLAAAVPNSSISAALGPNMSAVQVALGKMVDAAYAASN